MTIKEFLKSKGSNVTQRQLSDYLHLTESAISKWNSGVAKPSIYKMWDIAKLTDIPKDDIVQFFADLYIGKKKS